MNSKPLKDYKPNASLNDIDRELARRDHLAFMEYTWQKLDPLIVGQHTEEISNTLNAAFEKFDTGESVFLIIKVPFRHGKTDIISRYLPPHYLGRYPDNEILVTTYGSDLANEISRASRNIIKSEKYREVYPGIELSQESSSVQTWGIKNHLGVTNWVGVGGSITGKGYHLGIVDDFLKNREDAESQIIREKQWTWFTDVFLTRRAPVSITIILATPWHTDDIMGRIDQEMKKNKKFPRFKTIKFPAFSDKYKTGVLFPDRFSRQWYDQQRATLGSYGTASLLQCEPILKGGNVLKTDKIKIIDPATLPGITNCKWFRGWDLASTEKELLKSDPDYTAGCLMAVRTVNGAPCLYIKDMRRFQKEAPERDRIITQCARMDGPGTTIGIESVAGYKDTYTRIKDVLKGVATVKQITVSRDKLIRASVLEPIFEAGNVYLFKGDWNYNFIEECGQFPSGKHDDQIDALVAAYEMQAHKPGSFADIDDAAAAGDFGGIMKKQF